MNNTEIMLTIISVCGTLCGIVFGYLAFARNKKTDLTKEINDLTEMKIDIKYIKTSVGEIKVANKEQSEQLVKLDNRLTIVENKLDTHLREKGAN